MKRSSQSGSHVVMLAVAVAVIGVLAFAGYRVWTMQQANTQTADTATTVTVPKKITNTAQLNQAASALDTASTQVNGSLDDSALNADLSSML